MAERSLRKGKVPGSIPGIGRLRTSRIFVRTKIHVHTHVAMVSLLVITPVTGPIVETKNRAFFRERNFGRSITAPTTLFPLIGCGVDAFSPN